MRWELEEEGTPGAWVALRAEDAAELLDAHAAHVARVQRMRREPLDRYAAHAATAARTSY